MFIKPGLTTEMVSISSSALLIKSTKVFAISIGAFLLIFEANELGEEIYKESISSKLPEYSYKTIAQIIDDGLKKGYFIKLAPRTKISTDAKIRNIRPSEELVIEFINWNIDLLSTFSNLSKKFR